MTDPRIDKIAIALRDCAKTFEAPVGLYVGPEALRRARTVDDNVDFVDELESWRILARGSGCVALRE